MVKLEHVRLAPICLGLLRAGQPRQANQRAPTGQSPADSAWVEPPPVACLRAHEAYQPVTESMSVFLRIYPSRQQYRLPKDEAAGEVTKALAEVLGNRGCMVLGYEMPDQPRSTAVVLINGNVVESVELVEVPDEAPRK